MATGTPLHTGHSRGATAITAVCVAVDLLILLILASVVAIIVTGGGRVHVLGISVRARGLENPIWLLTGLMVLRYVISQRPFLGTRRLPVDSLFERGAGLVFERLPTAATRRLTEPFAGIIYLTTAVFLVKVFLAATSPGFFSGDDVEIHEMTLGVLLRKPWSAWDLRCAFFPMMFVYPAQRLALALGASSPEMLVLAGRAAVALVSSTAIPLTWWTARHLAPADPRLAALSVLLLAINKLQMSFGSSELPRPVSTVFVLAAFLCMIRGRVLHSALGGVFLGVAVAFRFSEVLFLPAAFATLRREQWWTRAVTVVIAAVLTAGAIIGAADAWYWGRPFSSLIAAIDYTVVQRESSRGYEPPWEYLRIIPAWSTFVFVALAVAGSSRRTPESWWLWVPIALLSLLPHKESRYLLPVIPFLCIAAARGFLRLSQWLRESAGMFGWQRWAKDLAAPLFLLGVLHDLGGWRLSRSNEGIRLAQYVRAAGGSGITGQDLWRLGGRTYLWPLEPIVDIHPDLLADRTGLAAAVRDAKWVALRYRVARTAGDSVMDALGFQRDRQWNGEDYVLYVRRR